MGYNIYVGNAIPYFSKDDGELYACWEVEPEKSDNAPKFVNDPSENGNGRYPSYTAWRNFCDEAGLTELFYNEDEGLIRNHPGCEALKEHHYLLVHAQLEKWKSTHNNMPGFCSDECIMNKKCAHIEPYDPILARLMWLDFWFRWALDNAETPALENG